jgi:protein-tyrosine-phosphatase
MNVVILCTGNVARSVMLGYMLTTIAEADGREWRVRTAGTHAEGGAAMSSRTRDALLALDDLGEHHYGAHRSHQVTGDDVAWADVVLAMEASQVHLARRWFPDAVGRIVQLGQFVRAAPLDESLAEQVAAVAALEPDATLDVADPAGGEQDTYDLCARELWEMAQVFAVVVGDA